MKINKIEYLIQDEFVNSNEFKSLLKEVYEAIEQIVWPDKSNSFTLYPERKRNGVKPIKLKFQQYLLGKGWQIEHRMQIASLSKPGPVDVVKKMPNGKYFAIEWETGNVSSSHRALNKLTIGLMNNILMCGILILPSKEMYKWLTDRVGNLDEISPYLPLWKNINVEQGILAIIEVEHDNTSEDVPPIPKGTDGRALR